MRSFIRRRRRKRTIFADRCGQILPRQTIENLPSAIELLKQFFFGAEFGRVRDERAAGAARRMFDVEHFVVEDVLDGALRDGGAIHAAIKQDVVGARIVAAELAAPGAIAPADVGASELSFEVFFV